MIKYIFPAYKTKDPLDKTIFSPITMLPVFSEIYERLIFHQLSRYANKALSKLLCDFRKALSMQTAIFRLPQ